MPEGTQVHVSGATGKPESIHIQRDPMRKRRGYYIKGMTGESREGYWPRRIYDQEVDCGNCRGSGIAPNDEVNARRSHYKQYHQCRTCGGTGRKS